MRHLATALVMLVSMIMTGAAAAQISRYVEGTHYFEVDTPVRTADSSRIEVIELFWYGCLSCYVFEPLISSWESNQAGDVDHKRLPAVGNSITTIHAQAFYAAQALDALDAVHNPFFDEIHQNRNQLNSEVLIREFFESCGISEQDFDRVFNSFSVRTRVNQAASLIRDYGVGQTPTMYVNGKYVVTLAVGSYQEMLNVVDYLVDLERG
ncbi:MAG: thioredoxin domain-containing protein [Pseudomonadales bacterium]|nr:thioredoxin domain-containing protein [Pseudomonadales bacterium]